MRQNIVPVVLLSIVLAACTPVSESDEYQALAAERDTLQQQLQAAEEDTSTLNDELASAQADLEEAHSALAAAQTELEDNAAAIADLETQLEETTAVIDELSAESSGAVGEPYPDFFRDEFVAGCAEGAPEGSEQYEGCVCMVDYLEDNLPFDEFIDLSLSLAIADEAELDPDNPALAIFFEAAFRCTL